MFDDWALTLKNLLLPTFCKRCDARLLTEENGFFCPRCWESSPRITRPFCSCCGRPHKGVVGFGTLSNFPCADCRELPPGKRPYRRIYGAAYYADAIEDAIKLFKFRDKPRLAGPLAEILTGFALEEMDCKRYDFLVPVPLHRVRERERRYNQSRLLAQEIVTIFPNARLDESLHRVRPTRTQSRLARPEERLRNVSGAFEVVNGPHLKNARVLLVDDVVTTAGTVVECTSALIRAGVAEVDILAVALAVAPPDPSTGTAQYPRKKGRVKRLRKLQHQ
ncbi:MAG: ComF family protein [FCB group bacterium]|jgi:ComF family protein|nr:ComF family protein [FCB group bacterium]